MKKEWAINICKEWLSRHSSVARYAEGEDMNAVRKKMQQEAHCGFIKRAAELHEAVEFLLKEVE